MSVCGWWAGTPQGTHRRRDSRQARRDRRRSNDPCHQAPRYRTRRWGTRCWSPRTAETRPSGTRPPGIWLPPPPPNPPPPVMNEKPLADLPEIVLEVIHTSPLVDKLDVYGGVGVGEVWVFRDGAFTIHVLDRAQGGYIVRPSSPLLPGLDFAVVARYAVREDTPQALREFEADVRR